ncbi:MAG: hypothetical protein D6762_01460 [Candidatus Neomarinimicrobiota bacterium]|nr:MAG: hypothetical protein D6762_01460 [Candidatus Neomarinimicrobiota bacterium]
MTVIRGQDSPGAAVDTNGVRNPAPGSAAFAVLPADRRNQDSVWHGLIERALTDAGFRVVQDSMWTRLYEDSLLCLSPRCLQQIDSVGSVHLLVWSLSGEPKGRLRLEWFDPGSGKTRGQVEGDLPDSLGEDFLLVNRLIRELVRTPAPKKTSPGRIQVARWWYVGGGFLLCGIGYAILSSRSSTPPGGIGLPPDWPEP